MESTTQTISQNKPLFIKAHVYSADTESGRLERLLEKDGVDFIGDWNKFYEINKLPNGGCRTSGLDMKDEDRAFRTIIISKLSMEQIAKIHGYEHSKMTRFLIAAEIEAILGDTIDRPQWSRLLAVKLIDFNNRHRPKTTKTYKGHNIPAYFAHASFDGMLFHHAWDKNVKDNFNPSMFASAIGGKDEDGF